MNTKRAHNLTVLSSFIVIFACTSLIKGSFKGSFSLSVIMGYIIDRISWVLISVIIVRSVVNSIIKEKHDIKNPKKFILGFFYSPFLPMKGKNLGVTCAYA